MNLDALRDPLAKLIETYVLMDIFMPANEGLLKAIRSEIMRILSGIHCMRAVSNRSILLEHHANKHFIVINIDTATVSVHTFQPQTDIAVFGMDNPNYLTNILNHVKDSYQSDI